MSLNLRALGAALAALCLLPIAAVPARAAPSITAPADPNMPGQGVCYGALASLATCVDKDHPLPVSLALIAGASFATPSGTSAYSSGNLIADTATAGSVTPLSFTACRVAAGTGMVRRARIKTPDTGFAGAALRLHLYRTLPTVANGDHAAWSSTESDWIGDIDVSLDHAFSDPMEKGEGAPSVGTDINFDCASASQLIYGLIEARGAITPQGAKTLSVVLEVLAN